MTSGVRQWAVVLGVWGGSGGSHCEGAWDGSSAASNAYRRQLAFIAFQAQAVNVPVAYERSAEPVKVAQAVNSFSNESEATVVWRKLVSRHNIVRVRASDFVQNDMLG
ncbi:hypothetical protein JQN47_27765, partial [Escherichia coli]|nr:hypothetical protein [Escherichia coli]